VFVCLCKAVTDRDIARAIEDGARSVDDVTRCTGAGSACGTCREAIGCAVAGANVAKRSEGGQLIALRILAAIVST
jgi:bacterioferritin-associated ferredoxin